MSMYDLYKTDPALEEGGLVIDLGKFRVTIARAGGANKKFAKVLEAKTKPYRRAMDTGTMDNTIAMGLMYQVYAAAVIVGWETLVDGEWLKGMDNPDGGELLPMTPDNIIAAFVVLPDLFLELQEASNKVALFREQMIESDSGN